MDHAFQKRMQRYNNFRIYANICANLSLFMGIIPRFYNLRLTKTPFNAPVLTENLQI